MEAPRLLTQTAEEYLADAERYERWAARMQGIERLSATFRLLAKDARSKAGQ